MSHFVLLPSKHEYVTLFLCKTEVIIFRAGLSHLIWKIITAKRNLKYKSCL